MKVWWWINAALLAAPLAFLPHFLATSGGGPQVERELGEARLGPWSVRAGLGEDFSRPAVLFRFCDGCFAAIRSARVVVAYPDGARVDHALAGDPNRLAIRLPALPLPGTAITLAAEGWDARAYIASWTVGR